MADENRELDRDLLELRELTGQLQAEVGNDQPSQSLLELALEQTNNSVLITTSPLDWPGPEIVYVNQRFTDMTGYSLEEVAGKTPRILQGPKTDRAVLDRLRACLATGGSFEGEAINYRKDGSEFHMHWRVAPIRSAQGEVTHFIAMQNDVTKLKAAEESSKNALLESEARYRELFENANDLVFTLNLEGTFTSLNKSVETATGYARKEIIGADLSLLVPSEHIDKVRAMIRRKMQTRGPTRYEIEILAASGRRIPVEISSRLIFEKGEAVGIQGIARDVTEQKRAEEDLRVAAAAFKTHESIMVTDDEGRIIRVNERFTEITGYTPEEVVGRNPRILKSGRHGREFYGEMWTAIRDRGYWEGEVWNRRKNGGVFPQRLTITAVKNELNVTTHYVGVAQDITQQKKAQADRTEIEAALTVQQALLPAAAPRLTGFEIAGAVFPTENGSGDFFDYLCFESDALGLLVADVAGHGLGPAILTAQTQAYLRALAESCSDPGELLTTANRLFSEGACGRMVTAFLGRLDAKARSFVYAGAGHQAYLLRADGETTVLESTGVPLGVLDDASVPSSAATALDKGDLILMPTDGIEEAPNRQAALFGRERMLAAARNNREKSPSQIIRALFDAARDFSEGQPQRDDITAVVVKVL